MKVTQHLWFEKDMESRALLPGWISSIPANNPSGPAGSVKLASFTLGDHPYKVAAHSI